VQVHNTNLALVPAAASVARPTPQETAAVLCSLALDACPARFVARPLGRSADVITGWGRGKSSPSLVQILGAPEAFRLRLLALAGQAYAPADVVGVPVRERLWLLWAALGALLATAKSWRPQDGLEDRSDAEIQEMVDNASKVEEEAKKIKDAGLRVLLDRRENKGAR